MAKRLLILGAGGHGNVVREVALSMKKEGNAVYETIDFLDDYASEAIGKINQLEEIKEKYDEVFCGIGNNTVRKELISQAERIGCTIATLIHPTAYLSPSAVIEPGTVVEPKAIVNARSAIQKGGIISVGAIVDHDVVIEPFVHVNAGAICKAGSRIERGRKLEAGEVVMGYPQIKNDLKADWVVEHQKEFGEEPGFF